MHRAKGMVVGSAVIAGLLVSACGGGGGGGPGSSNAALSDLVVSAGPLVPAFDPDTLVYGVVVGLATGSTTVTPTAVDPGAGVRVNGVPTASGTASDPIPLPLGPNAVTVAVRAEDGVTTRTYTVLFDSAGSGQQAYLKASNTGFTDEFGVRVAIDGDTMIVGAREEDSAATGVNGDQGSNAVDNSAAVYVFR